MKKCLSILIILGMLMTILPLGAFAADDAKLPLEKAISIAKEKVTIPAEYTEFESGYNQDEFTNSWWLRWYAPKNGGEVSVRIEADKSNEILEYSCYNPKDYQGTFPSIPKVSKKAGEKIALEFINKMAPSKAKQVKLQDNSRTYYGNPTSHSYNFVRVVNGVEYPANNISLEVNGHTGEVRYYYTNWQNVTINPIQAKISQEDAQKIFDEKKGVVLKYFTPGSLYRSAEQKAPMLIYELKNPYEISIDAVSGEIIEGSDMYYPSEYDKMSANSAAKEEAGGLSPQEEKVSGEIKGTISREEALEIAKKYVEINDKYKLNYSSLTKDWSNPQLYVWNFSWNYEENGKYGWASAEVNAKDKNILSFSYYLDNQNNDSKNKKVKSEQEAEKIGLDFVKTIYPDLVDAYEKQKNDSRLYQDQKDIPTYYFNYNRLVNGIIYENDRMNFAVDTATGKVNNFSIRYSEQEFPSVDKAIDKAAFTKDYFASNPMQLAYVKDKNNKFRLIYRIAPTLSNRFDAVKGNMIDWNGEPVKEKATSVITDINDNPYKESINVLNELDMLHIEDGKFNPKATLTQAELIKALSKATNNYLTDETSGNWYDPYYEVAKGSGLILEKEINPKAQITRQELAKFLTRTLLMDKIATLDIYKLDKIKDSNKISKGYNGYVAIINELGILTANKGNWNPQGKVQKDTSCLALMRWLQLERKAF